MSVQCLYTAATGMDAMQTRLDVVANNLANINTTGFKRGRANFEDTYYRNYIMPSENTPTGVAVGLGVRVSSTQTEQRQGAYQTTGNPLDVAIDGRGFFVLEDPVTNETVYTRAGNFSLNATGELVAGSAHLGRRLPGITIPQGAQNVTISSNGQVLALLPGTTTMQSVGQIQMASFPNPEGLLKRGENLYVPSDSSGAVQNGNPGQDGIGSLQANALEASNVEPVAELIDLITTQRSFELNSQAIQAGDQVLQLISNLRR